MAKKQPDQVPAKFAEDNKYAPNWGRLHLKWGEALGYVGRNEEARAHCHPAGLKTNNNSAADPCLSGKVGLINLQH